MTRLLQFFCVALLISFAGCMSPEQRLARGDELYLQGRYSEALRHYQIARRKAPTLVGIDEKIHTTQIRVYIDRGDKCVQLRQWDAAQRAYEEVRRLDPDNGEIDERLDRLKVGRANHHFRRGQELMGRGNPFDAIAEFEQALALKPDHPRAATSLDQARRIKKDRETRAETAYQAGLRARDAARYEVAIRHFAQALKFNPHHVSAGLELRQAETSLVDGLIRDGDSSMATRRFHDALTAYQKAFERAPDRPDLASRINRAELEAQALNLVAEGDRALARKDWQQAFERFDAARRLTAEPEVFRTQFEQARNRFADDLYGTAQTHERAGRYDEALAVYGSIVGFHPGYRNVVRRHENLGRKLDSADEAYDAGCRAQQVCDLLTARDHFRRCVTILPGYRDATKRLDDVTTTISMAERLYERATRAETAREYPRARLLYEECLAVALRQQLTILRRSAVFGRGTQVRALSSVPT